MAYSERLPTRLNLLAWLRGPVSPRRDAGYRPTAADAEVARASSWQTHCHMVGGALGFVASPLVEAAALAALLPRGWPAALALDVKVIKCQYSSKRAQIYMRLQLFPSTFN